MKRKPGIFMFNDRPHVAVSNVPYETSLTASEVADAIAAGVVKVQVCSGCKIISLADLFTLVNLKGGAS